MLKRSYGRAAIMLYADKYLRCTYCGKTFAPLQWSKSGTKHCKKCGKPFVYDK